MLHELLFVLSGYPGDVFVPHPAHPETPSTFAIPLDFPLLHPTERDSLNRLGQLGWIYAQITNFVASVKDLKANCDASRPHGTYVQALVTAMEDLLNDYRDAILAMEKRILNKEDDAGDGIVPLAHLTSSLARWELLLPALLRFVRLLEDDPARYHGCRLFDLLMAQARTGINDYRALMEKMIRNLHDVLYRQLTTWMVYGQLTDPHTEFFIVRCDGSVPTKAGWQRHYTLALDRLPEHLPRSLAHSILFVGRAVTTVSAMPARIVQDGETLQDPSASQSMPKSLQQQHLELLLTLHSSSRHDDLPSPWIAYPQQIQRVVYKIRRSTATWLFSRVLIGEHDLLRYLQSFRCMFLLGYGDLASNLLELGDQWRSRSTALTTDRRLSTQAPATQSYKHARDDGPGDGPSSRSPEAPAEDSAIMRFRQRELDALLVKASVGTDAEDHLDGYSLQVLSTEEEGSSRTHFANLLPFHQIRCKLTFELCWPIDLLLSQTDVARYSELWTFLMGVKHVQKSLGKLWKVLRGESTIHHETNSRHTNGGIATKDKDTHETEEEEDEGGHEERIVWRLRSHMQYWVDTLWSHVQTQVIDPHYKKLIETLSPSGDARKRRSVATPSLDFESLQTALDTCLEEMANGSLLSSRTCAQEMFKTLHVCLEFCSLVERVAHGGAWKRSKRRKTVKTAAEIVNDWAKSFGKPKVHHAWIDQLADLESEFARRTETFFGLVSNAKQEIKSSGNLDVLLMQLDYNAWYSTRHRRRQHLHLASDP